MKTELTVGSCFDGISSAELGFLAGGKPENVTFNTKWRIENERFRQQVSWKRFPKGRRFNDICKASSLDLEPVDLIVGGFPCQDLSVAGPKTGLEGERSGLWFEMERIIHDLRPRYVLVENVRGLINRGIDTVLGALARDGYSAEWGLLPAAAVGAPHLRERVFILAYPPDIGEKLGKKSLFSGRVPYSKKGVRWLTPHKSDGFRTRLGMKNNATRNRVHALGCISEQIGKLFFPGPEGETVRFPTPTAHMKKQDVNDAGQYAETVLAGGFQISLPVAAKALSAVLPTPTRKGNYNKPGSGEKSGTGLLTLMSEPDPEGVINPEFVERVMGFPRGWTDLSSDVGPDAFEFFPWGSAGRARDIFEMKNIVEKEWNIPLSIPPTGDQEKRIAACGDSMVPQVMAFLAARIAKTEKGDFD